MPVRTEASHAELNLLVYPEVEDDADDTGNDLSEDGGGGGTGDAHFREGAVTEDQDRIHDDIDDGTRHLADHGIDRFSCCRQQTLHADLNENTDAQNTADLHVGDAVFIDQGVFCLQTDKARGRKIQDQSHNRIEDNDQKNSLLGDLAHFVKLLCSERPG